MADLRRGGFFKGAGRGRGGWWLVLIEEAVRLASGWLSEKLKDLGSERKKGGAAPSTEMAREGAEVERLLREIAASREKFDRERAGAPPVEELVRQGREGG